MWDEGNILVPIEDKAKVKVIRIAIKTTHYDFF